jgi:hypothetical protein
MTIYYRDDSVTVCETTLAINGDEYDLDHLEYLWHHHRRSGGGHLRSRLLLGAILAVLGAAGVIALLLWVDFGEYRWHVLSGSVVLGLGLIAAAGFGIDPLLDLLDRGHDHAGGTHEIWARIDGADILLLSTTDSLRFGKVYRALQRAMERQRGQTT